MNAHLRRPHTLPVACALLLLLLIGAVSACTSDDSFTSSGAESGADGAAADYAGDAAAEQAAGAQAAADVRSVAEPMTRAIISTGNVALRADDVGKARFDVIAVLDRFGGEISENETGTDDEGRVAYTRMVVRVPAADFSAALEALSEVATLVDASSSSQDVTTEVIDTDVRVRVQRRSIERIELLLDRAQSIKDIVAVEAQLSRREADLSSLEQQQSHLADQTSLSTVTVSIEQTAPASEESTSESGFLAGLSSGWGSLTSFAVALATATGTLLPWLLTVGLLGLAARLAQRRLQARRPASAPLPTPAAPGGSTGPSA